MARLATVRWRTPAPTSVDEDLAVYDDGTAWLVVRRAAGDRTAVGTFRTEVSDEERSALAGAGSVEIDLLHPAEGAAAQAAALAGRIAQRARTAPHAVARFYGRTVPGPAGPAGSAVTVALAVVGEGGAPVVFELDPAAVTVHFGAGGAIQAWAGVTGLATGFVTPDAQGLGGLHGRATVAPGQVGALMVPASPPAGATEVTVQLGGWLVEALPDEPERQRFEARTTAAPLG